MNPPRANAVISVNIMVPKTRGSLVRIRGMSASSDLNPPCVCSVASAVGLNRVMTMKLTARNAAMKK